MSSVNAGAVAVDPAVSVPPMAGDSDEPALLDNPQRGLPLRPLDCCSDAAARPLGRRSALVLALVLHAVLPLLDLLLHKLNRLQGWIGRS